MSYEYGVESYRFTCHGCQHTWTTEYEVRYATDSEGSAWTVHFRDGAPAENPAADVIVCAHCRHATVYAHLDARHDRPTPPTPDPDPTAHTVAE